MSITDPGTCPHAGMVLALSATKTVVTCALMATDGHEVWTNCRQVGSCVLDDKPTDEDRQMALWPI